MCKFCIAKQFIHELFVVQKEKEKRNDTLSIG